MHRMSEPMGVESVVCITRTSIDARYVCCTLHNELPVVVNRPPQRSTTTGWPAVAWWPSGGICSYSGW